MTQTMGMHFPTARGIMYKDQVVWRASVILLMTGCLGQRALAPSIRAGDSTLGSIRISPWNAIMAVGDTLSFPITGLTIAGTPITGFDSVRYALNSIVDTLRVRVSPIGVITARANSGSIIVFLNAYAYKDGVGAADQAGIQVTTTSFPGATLSIQPVPPDSARLAIGSQATITPVIRNPTTGQSVSGARFRLATSAADAKKVGCYRVSFPSNTAAFTITSAQLVLNGCGTLVGTLNFISAVANTGTAWIHANAIVYGTLLQDSVQYTLTNSFQVFAGAGNQNLAMTCACSELIAPGGIVTFQNNFASGLGMSASFTMDNPAAALAATSPSTIGGSSGNVSTLTAGQSSDRRFVTPGTYKWTETVTGATPPFTNGTFTGTVVVQ